jgi:hypothetical protein
MSNRHSFFLLMVIPSNSGQCGGIGWTGATCTTRFEDLPEGAILGESPLTASATGDEFSFSDYVDYELRQLG